MNHLARMQWCVTHQAPLHLETEIYKWCLRYNSNHPTQGDCRFVDATLTLAEAPARQRPGPTNGQITA